MPAGLVTFTAYSRADDDGSASVLLVIRGLQDLAEAEAVADWLRDLLRNNAEKSPIVDRTHRMQ